MKYLAIALLIAAIAGAEVLHALSSDAAPEAAVCTATGDRMDAVRDHLLAHLRGH